MTGHNRTDNSDMNEAVYAAYSFNNDTWEWMLYVGTTMMWLYADVLFKFPYSQEKNVLSVTRACKQYLTYNALYTE